MTMMRFVMYWALANVAVPVAILIVSEHQGGVFEWPYLALILWPSSMLMGAIYGPVWSAFGLLVLAISIGLNVVLDSAVGSVSWFLFNRFLK